MNNVILKPQLVLIIFAVIIVVTLYLTVYYGSYFNFHHSYTYIALVLWAPLSIALLVYITLILLMLQREQENMYVAKNALNYIETVYYKLLPEFIKANKIVPNFISSLMPLTYYKAHIEPDPNTIEADYTKKSISLSIFAIWQQFLISRDFLDVRVIPNLAFQLQLANSKELYTYWNIYQIDFVNDTVTLGNLFFKYGLPITEQIPESYSAATNALVHDPDFIKLLK